jgi:hypothetical protein
MTMFFEFMLMILKNHMFKIYLNKNFKNPNKVLFIL